MMILNDNRVCSECGGFGDANVCQNCGITPNEWITSQEFLDRERISKNQQRADKIYSKLIERALKMWEKNIEEQTVFNKTVNGYSSEHKPFFLAAFRLSKYNHNDKYQKEWDNKR